MSVHIYDPAEVLVLVSGVPMSGFSRGQFISVDFDEQSFTKEVGVYGEVSRYRNVNNSGSMTLTLAQSSNSNMILSSLSFADRRWGVGVVPIAILDLKGGANVIGAPLGISDKTIGPSINNQRASRAVGSVLGSKMLSAQGWVQKPPPLQMGRLLSTRTWVLDLARIDLFQVSGNQSHTL